MESGHRHKASETKSDNPAYLEVVDRQFHARCRSLYGVPIQHDTSVFFWILHQMTPLNLRAWFEIYTVYLPGEINAWSVAHLIKLYSSSALTWQAAASFMPGWYLLKKQGAIFRSSLDYGNPVTSTKLVFPALEHSAVFPGLGLPMASVSPRTSRPGDGSCRKYAAGIRDCRWDRRMCLWTCCMLQSRCIIQTG